MELELLKKRLERERAARKQAESILEQKAAELYEANSQLVALNENLEEEIKLRSKELSDSELRYRRLVEQASDIFFNIDDTGRFTYMNATGVHRFGYDNEEIVGHYFSEFVPDSHKKDLILHYALFMSSDRIADYKEFPIKSKTGEVFWMGQNVNRLNDDSSKPYFSAVARDISKQKILKDELELARQAAVKAQKAEKQFLANMSHEIRTPLNAIIGMSHLINDTPLSEEQGEYVDILISSTGILKNLISDILDMSKIDAGTLVLQEKEFSIEKDIKSLVRSFLHKSKDKAVTYRYEVDPKIKNEIITDQQLLNQVLLNLYSNGDKFTESGSVSLTVNIVSETVTNLNLLFSVEDTGIGIDKKEVTTVFDEFKQANKEIRSKYGGTGLGLSISKKLLNLMGSDIKLESIPGEGSNFYFELSVKKGRLLEDAKAVDKEADLTGYQGQSRMILVVEDNKLNVKYLTRLLEKWSIDFVVKSNGREAVDFCEDNFPDLILMDLQMPVMDGFEATQIIRKMDNANAYIPIIALTASTFLSKKQMAEQVGMTDFLSKPFTPDQLNTKLRIYLENSPSEVVQLNNSKFSDKLDTGYLQSAYGDDAAYSLEIFETYMEIIDDEISTLKQVLMESDDGLKNHLHKIKPIFTMVGLSHISEIVKHAEQSYSDKDNESVTSQCHKVIEETSASLPIILAEIKRLKTIV